MNLEINQSNLYLILPGKVSWMASYAVKRGVDVVTAVRRIYSSETYRVLEVEETKMWHLGPVDLYSDFAREKTGRAERERDLR